MSKSEFYNKLKEYLHHKKMNNSFMDKTELCNKIDKWLTNSKYTREKEVNYKYRLVRIGKILMFKRFKTGV